MKQALSGIHPRRPLFWLLLAAVAGLLAWGFWPRPLAVETARIGRGPLVVSIQEEARTRLRDRYLVSAPLAGTVQRIVLRPGDRVAARQVVAVLEPSAADLLDRARRAEIEARVHAAEHALQVAQADGQAAAAERATVRTELQRAESLHAQRLVARSALDRARTAATAADAALRAARARTGSAEAELQAARALLTLQGQGGGARLELRAPVAGTVLRRLVESSGAVAAGAGLLEIGDPANIEVVAELLTSDAVRVGPGTRVRLTRWGGEQALAGHVRTVEPGGFTKVSALGVEEQRVLVVVDLDTPAAARGRLGDGFRLEAEFLVWESPSVLSVPTAALFHDDERWAVYVVEDGRARLRPVELGPMGEASAALRGGLAAGEQVVLYPGQAVREGMRVVDKARRKKD